MSSLIEVFPSLARELSNQLSETGHAALAEQVDGAMIERVTYDEAVSAGYIYVRPSRPLNVVESNIVGVRHGSTIEVDTGYWTYIDTDDFDRLVGIEILAPGDMKSELKKRASS